MTPRCTYGSYIHTNPVKVNNSQAATNVSHFMMGYEFDNWNRMLTMDYPDGEDVTYNYVFGGDLYSMIGHKTGNLPFARIGGGRLDSPVPNSPYAALALSLYNSCSTAVNSRVLVLNDVECIHGISNDDDNFRIEIYGLPNRLQVESSIGLTVFDETMDYYYTHNDPETNAYYYHSDHLGSASWITGANGQPVQHLRHLPYGEPFINQRTAGYEERFTFTGKERDAETGYSYFGARYYDSGLPNIFLSVDPISDKYPGISPYAYCAWNPVKLVDPDGREIDLSALYDNNGNRKKECESICKIFEFFAKTSIGQKYLGRYAKKGQIIAGHEYKEDGIYHKKGIDLSVEYGKSQFNADNRSGYTDANTIKEGRLKLNIHILPETSEKDSKAYLLDAFCHEFFIHAIQYSDKFSPRKANTWKTKDTDAYTQHMADIKTKHLMRDCAIPILTKFCGGNKQKAIDIISQETNYKNNPSWYKK